jgi:hypothetical protein
MQAAKKAIHSRFSSAKAKLWRWRMGEKNEISMFWPTTENVEQLKKALALLP